jgi:RNA polymerase sigma factor (sigma-70 family)
MVIDHLRRMALLPAGGGLNDEQLLEIFLLQQENAAFQALVTRHGPMVLGVCHRILGNSHDAEDAYQATFLVFLRNAKRIGQKALLPKWLYGVARRTALQARRAAARRRARERRAADVAQQQDKRGDGYTEMLPFLDQELSRLPDKYQVPIILCDLEGLTRKRAAELLGLLEGTLSMRLDRARALLAKRLARHGTILSGAALALVISQNVAAASVPQALLSSTGKMASLVAIGTAGMAGAIPPTVSALAKGTVISMFLTKAKIMTTVVLLAGFVGAGAMFATQALTAQPGSGQQEGGGRQAGEQVPAVQEKAKKDETAEAKEAAASADDKIRANARIGVLAKLRADAQLRELFQERLEALRKRLELTMTKVELGKITLDSVIPPLSELFHAELLYSTSDQGRLAVCEKFLPMATELEKTAKQRLDGGAEKIPLEVVLSLKSLRLEIEIAHVEANLKVTLTPLLPPNSR